jgi:molybdopterin converting factor subunit 1
MRLTVLYFAAVRELAGTSEMSLDLPAGVTTVRELAAHLEKTVAGLGGKLGAVRWAKNEVFVGLDARLEEGDVVAAIPPVAGGAR